MRIKPQTYALTAVAHQRRRIFQRTTIAELFIATFFRYRDAGKFQLHAFVVMPDHVHVLLTPTPDMAIERCAQLIKGGFSFAVRKDISGEIWQGATTPTESPTTTTCATKPNTSSTTPPGSTSKHTRTSTPHPRMPRAWIPHPKSDPPSAVASFLP